MPDKKKPGKHESPKEQDKKKCPKIEDLSPKKDPSGGTRVSNPPKEKF